MPTRSPRIIRYALAALLLPAAAAAQQTRPHPATPTAIRSYPGTEVLRAAQRNGLDVDTTRLEFVSTRDGALVIAPTAAALTGAPPADGQVMMLVGYSIAGAGGRPVTGFFQVAYAAPEGSRLPAPRPGGPVLPASLALEIAWRMNGSGAADQRRFKYRFLPSMGDVLTPIDATDTSVLNWPQ